MLASILLQLMPLVAGVPLEPAAAGGRLSVEEALALAFPGCEIERSTVYLSAGQKAAVKKLAGDDAVRSIVRPYEASREGVLVGTAYDDTHKVRTKKETLMITVLPAGTIGRVELLAFAEPEAYVPRGSWYGQFPGRGLDEDLRLGRGIRGVTGATLTARATTVAARRTLALHAVIGRGTSAGR